MEDIRVIWEVANSEGFDELVARGQFISDPGRDYTVKVDVTGLQPNTTYYYRFRNQGNYSVIGRTKTLPVGDIPG